MNSMIKISAVSYLNTLPFIYGIQHSGFISNVELTLSPPAMCAEDMQTGKADIALIPVGALKTLKEVNVITDYCIGATNKVQSVLLLSNCPLHKITSIGLDTQSRTSIELIKVLAKHYWQIEIETYPIDIQEKLLHKLPEAMVCIGDKTFQWQAHYTYQFDLAAEWQKFSGLPFVFAVWVAQSNLKPETILALNKALAFGLSHITETIQEYCIKNEQPYDIEEYLLNAISFDFDAKKQSAMQTFLTYI